MERFRRKGTNYTLHPRNLRRRGLRLQWKMKRTEDGASLHQKATNAPSWMNLVLAITFATVVDSVFESAIASILLVVDMIVVISIVIVAVTFEIIRQYTYTSIAHGQHHQPFRTWATAFFLGVSPLYAAAQQYNNINDEIFFETGRWLISRRGCQRMSYRRFRAFFGAMPAVCADMWQMMNPFEEMSKYARPVHLLWGLMLMKVYATEEVLAGIAGVSEKTFRKWSWKFIKGMSALSYNLVSDESYQLFYHCAVQSQPTF